MKKLGEQNVIVKREETLPTVSTLVGLAGETSEEFKVTDLPRPAVRIAHFMSPHIIPENEKYIEGLKPGMIFNTGTGDMWSGDEDKGIVILPVKYLAKEIEWLLGREGFVAEHEVNDPITKRVEIEEFKDEKGQVKKLRVINHPGGSKTMLVHTAVYHCFLFRDGFSYDEIVIDMTSSQWSTARDWNLFLRKHLIDHPEIADTKFNPPIYYNLFRLYTKYKESTKGNWYLWKFKFMQSLEIDSKDKATADTHQSIFGAALKHRKQIEDGRVKVDYSSTTEENPAPEQPTSKGAFDR